MKTLYSFTAATLVSLSAFCQEIKLENPSFEGKPATGVIGYNPVVGWIDCGKSGESPPDIQPNAGFSVFRPAQSGNTYVGLVTRDNDTWEGLSQKLASPMEAGACYNFSANICKSATYRSLTRTTKREEDFTKPIKFRIWGGNNPCEKSQMLAESPLISNTEWQQFSFKLQPSKSYTYISIEAYYNTPVLLPYNGNILVDGLSSLVKVNCKTEQPLAGNTKPINAPPVKPKTNPATPPTKPNNPATPTPEPAKEPIVNFDPSVKTSDLKEGDVLRIQNLYFKENDVNITAVSNKTLDELYYFLLTNKGVVIEIGGHTNGLPDDAFCDNLSSNRARKVAEYLIRKGIPATRVKHKGYGKREPIATNETAEGRRKNQRVEVKILKVR